jgi:hypothetical protein
MNLNLYIHTLLSRKEKQLFLLTHLFFFAKYTIRFDSPPSPFFKGKDILHKKLKTKYTDSVRSASRPRRRRHTRTRCYIPLIVGYLQAHRTKRSACARTKRIYNRLKTKASENDIHIQR